MKLQPLVNRGGLLVCCLISGLTVGLSSDPDQPIEVEADSAELDDKERIAVYQGNVVVIQGSIRLTGMDYDTKRSILTLQSSGKIPSSEKPSAAERVKIIIPPKEKKKQE